MRIKIKNIVSQFDDQQAAFEILYLLAQSKLFATNLQLAIKDNEIIKLNSENGISISRSKVAIKQLEERQLISQISARPKQHILNFK